MKITISPKTAGFKSGILFFNLRKSIYKITDEDIYPEYDICFVFDEYAVYVDIDPGLAFGVRELSSGEMYGPYNDCISVISLHLFGKYDNLLKFLRESFVFDSELGAYRFIFDTFNYARGVYDFTENISKVTRKISDYLPAINEPFEYEFTPMTYFADGVLEVFINKLNVMFNQNNFTEKSIDTDNYIMGSVDRASGYGVRENNGKAFFVANLSKKRHSVFFCPKRLPQGYIDFLSDGSQFAEDILYKYITTAPVETITNKSKVDLYKTEYGISSTEKSVSIAQYKLFDDVIFILAPTDNVQEICIFVKTDDYGIVPLTFDSFTKRFVIHEQAFVKKVSSSMSNANIAIDENTLKFAYNSDISKLQTLGDLAMGINEIQFYVDCKKNRAFTNNGNIFAINYAGDLLHKIFV